MLVKGFLYWSEYSSGIRREWISFFEHGIKCGRD